MALPDRSTLHQIPRSKSFVSWSRVKFKVSCAKSGRNHVMRFIMFREISLSAVSLRHSYLLPSFIYRCIGGPGASSFGILFSRLSRKRGRNRSPKRTSAGTSERSTFDRIKYGRGWRIHATIVN